MSRYAAVHAIENQKGPGDARPTAMQIVHDEKREGDLTGKVAVVTGTSSGIGPPTVAALVATGATVYALARDLEKTKTALGKELLDSGKVHLVYIDQTDLKTVKAAAEEIIQRESNGINLLVNNAGVMMIQTRTETKDGFETQIGTNHFAHFYLFALLKDLLQKGSKASPDFASRVVNVSSSGHRWAKPAFDDLQLEKPGAYNPMGAYGASKTANIWMANEIERRYGKDPKGPIHGYSLMPGGIETPLQRHTDPNWMKQMLAVPKLANYMKSPEQGASTTLFAAVARELEGKGGVFLEDAQVAPPAPEGPLDDVDYQIAPGYAPHAYSPEDEAALWKVSLKLVGLPENF